MKERRNQCLVECRSPIRREFWRNVPQAGPEAGAPMAQIALRQLISRGKSLIFPSFFSKLRQR
jgi:hypothetical protein